MGSLYHSSGTLGRFRINTWRGSPTGEFVDGLVITRRDTDDGEVVRIAAFDPAENLTVADHRMMAHRAVAVAVRWFSADMPAVEAALAANAELHDPDLADPMTNPLVTAVWADVRADGQVLRLVDAGRVGDGDVAVRRADGTLVRLCSTPLWEQEAEAAWLAWVNTNRPTPVELWEARSHYVGQRYHYRNPPLGQFFDPTPEAVVPVVINVGDSIVVATDGAELDLITAGEQVAMADHINAIVARAVTADSNIAALYSHSDIAAAEICLDD
jgi:hypothetical protein